MIAALSEKPKAHLLRILSEVLRRKPNLASVVRAYADRMDDTDAAPTTLAVYRERIDGIFGPGFLEQHQLQKVLTHLEGLVQHAKSLSHLGETDLALSILHALIHQSIVRYPDTLQKQELPRFVKQCTTMFARIAMNAEDLAFTGFDIDIVPVTLHEHYRMLLELSFDASPVFTPLLTRLLQQCCAHQDSADFQATLEQRLDESPDRQAHVHLLFDCYLQSGNIGECLGLARRERENYLLIYTLFTHQQDAAAWRALEIHPLSADAYECLLESPIATRIQGFTDTLLTHVRHHAPDTAIALYHRWIEKTVGSRKRKDYEKVRDSLTDLRTLYTQCGQEHQSSLYFTDFRKRHARKRVLLETLDAQSLP